MMRSLLLFALLLLSVSTANGQDVIFLKSGERLEGRIDEITDKIVNFTLASAGGAPGGTARRTFQTPTIEKIDFGYKSGEDAVFSRRSEAPASLLKTWWDYYYPHLHRPSSRSAAYGIAYANALLREDPAEGGGRALSIFDHILARAWSAEEVTAAKEGRLRALISLGDLETASLEAEAIARESDDPALLIEVDHLLATADFAALRVLDQEHPRWIEDDEVRPRRNDLFLRTLDAFLRPHLFHATREDAAARGLFSAAELYHYNHEKAEAKHRWEDLVSLYPSSPFAAESTKRLEALSLQSSSPPSVAP